MKASVRFLLVDGESVELRNDVLQDAYRALWDLAPEPGAVSTAALLMHEMKQAAVTRKTIELTAPQSAVLREAMSRLH